MGVRMDEVLFVANHAFDCLGPNLARSSTAEVARLVHFAPA